MVVCIQVQVILLQVIQFGVQMNQVWPRKQLKMADVVAVGNVFSGAVALLPLPLHSGEAFNLLVISLYTTRSDGQKEYRHQSSALPGSVLRKQMKICSKKAGDQEGKIP